MSQVQTLLSENTNLKEIMNRTITIRSADDVGSLATEYQQKAQMWESERREYINEISRLKSEVLKAENTLWAEREVMKQAFELEITNLNGVAAQNQTN